MRNKKRPCKSIDLWMIMQEGGGHIWATIPVKGKTAITRCGCYDVSDFSRKGVITNPGKPGLTSKVSKDVREKAK